MFPVLALRGAVVRRLAGAVLLAALIVALQTHAGAKDKIDAVALKKVKAATIHIRVTLADGDVSQGSGFVTSAKGLVVTNAHVVGMLDNDSPKPSKIEVTFNSGEPNSKTVEVKVGYVDGESDVALLMMSPNDIKIVPELLPVFLSAGLLETQDVFVVGFPLGKQAGANVTVTATTVTALRKEGNNIKQVQVNGGMHPGNSGGPVVDKEGRLVGIAVASYAGTQLHLAIPTEIMNGILNGRIMNSAYGVPYRDGDKLKIPFHFEKADPLNKMKSISVETWTGKSGPGRAATSKKPDVLPDDSPVTVVEAKQDEKGIYSGELVLDGKKDPKQVFWNRYQVGRGGDQIRWYPGTMFAAANNQPAVERKAITLKNEPMLGKTDVLALTSESNSRIRIPGLNDTALAMILKGNLKEEVTSVSKDGKCHKRVSYEGIETTVTEDKKPIEGAGADRFLKALKDAKFLASEIDVEKDGTISRHLIDASKVPRASKDPLENVSEQVQLSLDSLALPLPAKEIAAQDTWKGQQSYVISTLKFNLPVKAEVTFRYEGVYKRGDKPMAVVTFEGPLTGDFPKSKKGGKPPELTGKAEGKITIAADTGVIQAASEKIRAEVAMETPDGKQLKAIGTFNVTLTRNPPAAKK